MSRRRIPRSVAQRLAHKVPTLFAKRVVIRGPVIGEPTDTQLLDAWAGIPTAHIRQLVALGAPADEKPVTGAEMHRARKRVLALRQAADAGAPQ